MIEKMRNELMSIEEGIRYMEDADTAWSPAYTKLCKKRKLLMRFIRRIERLDKKQNECS